MGGEVGQKQNRKSRKNVKNKNKKHASFIGILTKFVTFRALVSPKLPYIFVVLSQPPSHLKDIPSGDESCFRRGARSRRLDSWRLPQVVHQMLRCSLRDGQGARHAGPVMITHAHNTHMEELRLQQVETSLASELVCGTTTGEMGDGGGRGDERSTVRQSNTTMHAGAVLLDSVAARWNTLILCWVSCG